VLGGCALLVLPLYELIRAHVFAGERVHGDETPVPVLAKHQCRKGRLWVYVRDDKPFAGQAPPAAVFFYSRDRRAEHPERPTSPPRHTEPQRSSVTNGSKLPYRRLLSVDAPMQGHDRGAHLGSRWRGNCSVAEGSIGITGIARSRCGGWGRSMGLLLGLPIWPGRCRSP
jgi:hypothetical protein